MKIEIRTGPWTEQQAAAQAIRYAVFVIEQKIPVELEWDDMDAVSLHAVAYDENGISMGTGRLLPDGHVGRMAVKKNARGFGVGGALLDALVELARQRGDKRVVLNAQVVAEPFYAAHGFVRSGPEFLDAGIPHIEMAKDL
ncbi:MAG TPA: GNAT family N-acetyltransferase [Burkholderiaceae bacterium]